ncbi:MAG: citrate synthase/methylcitrate synthase, partial [Thermoplasmata archaeon]|nr:citrate synthase/methylcitrate synthase [Thermoplasmata archaeon]
MLRPMAAPRAPEKGLEHVVMGESSVARVAGETGGLAYRGFDIAELVGHASFEAVLHLLLRGDPPTAAEESALTAELIARRPIGPTLSALADATPTEQPPLDALRTLISGMGDRSFGYPPTREQGLDLVAKAPTLLARFVRRTEGKSPIDPHRGLGHVANYLYMLNGASPEPDRVRALESYFILLADHGMNASTFALRVVLSTNADLIAGAVAGLAALKGPLHGGAPSKVSDMLDAI